MTQKFHFCICVKNTLADIQYDVWNTTVAKTGNKLNVHQQGIAKLQNVYPTVEYYGAIKNKSCGSFLSTDMEQSIRYTISFLKTVQNSVYTVLNKLSFMFHREKEYYYVMMGDA